MTDMQNQEQNQVEGGFQDTINDRIEETKDVNNHNENEQDWIEIRVQGKLPERRSNHTACIVENMSDNFLYVHGGHDLKEGAMNSMWRVDLNAVHQLFQDTYYPVAWEHV